MTTIPNELKITINTSVPGYQTLLYNPNMTIQTISKDDQNIQFNPMVKLKKEAVDKVPENIKIKEFFNKGLFQSLIHFTKSPSAKSLEQATSDGYVDNNIKITLDSIFPTNSVLYINKKPYVIVDVQWTKGEWNIDTKQKLTPLDSKKITNPYLHSTTVRDEIISGENQLNNLPNKLVYGPNYDKPKNDVVPVTKHVVPTMPKQLKQITNQVPQTTKQLTQTTKQLTQITNQVPQITNQVPQVPSQVTQVPQITNQVTQVPQITNQVPQVPSQVTQVTNQITPLIDNEDPSPEVKLITSGASTKFLKTFFNDRNYYSILNTIYQNMNNNYKNIIRNILLQTTSVDVKESNLSLSDKAYKETVKGLNVYKNEGGGDCFFVSVADAINFHNYSNPNDKIISGIYGKNGNIFTKKYLRSLVAKFILSSENQDMLKQYYTIALANVNEMNNTFKQQLKAIENATVPNDIEPEQYVNVANSIYIDANNDNFLVNRVKSIPIIVDDYYHPFTLMSSNKIAQYILSPDYWANELSMYALSDELKINVIPIEKSKNKSDDKYILKIPYANFKKDTYNGWKKYMFLFFDSGHYELITFTYNIRKVKQGELLKPIPKKITLFNRSDNLIMPPLYILLIIFGSYYYNQSDDIKNDFSFLPEIMSSMEISLNKFFKDNQTTKSSFLKLFKRFFPNSITNSTLDEINGGEQDGGIKHYPNPYPNPYPQFATPNYPSYNPYSNAYLNPYSHPYTYKEPIKKNHTKDTLQIAYYITIEMELHPGTSISPEELDNIKCRQKWNAVRKAYSEFMGKKYIIPPVYQYHPTNKTQKYRGGKRNKTQKI